MNHGYGARTIPSLIYNSIPSALAVLNKKSSELDYLINVSIRRTPSTASEGTTGVGHSRYLLLFTVVLVNELNKEQMISEVSHGRGARTQ